MGSREARFIPYPYERVFQEAQNALIECRFSISFADIHTGQIHCSVSSDVRAWFGESVDIYISNAPNGAYINIKSSAKGPMPTTFGKSEDNIDDFFLALNRRLQQPGPGAAPSSGSKTVPPPPPPQSTKCPSCSGEARFILEYNRWYCDRCGRYL